MDGLLRSYVLSVRLTPGERIRVQEAARALGISAGQLARLRMLGQPLPQPRPARAPVSDINVAAYRQLGAIGNNLNQLARHFNLRAGDDPEAAEVLAEMLQRMPEQNDQLLKALSQILDEHRAERRQHQGDRASSERLLQSLHAATQRVESLVNSTSGLLERETATLTAARRQLWDEAAVFKQEVRREIRWFLRAPLVALLLLAVGIGVLWMHREPTPDSRDRPPATRPTERLDRRR